MSYTPISWLHRKGNYWYFQGLRQHHLFPPNLERLTFRLTLYCSPDTLPVLHYDKISTIPQPLAFNLLFLSLPLRTMRLAKYPLLRHIGYSEFPTTNVGWCLSIGSIFLSFQRAIWLCCYSVAYYYQLPLCSYLPCG